MEWRDEAIVLALRPHGERGAVVSLLTRDHGRHPGLVRGAQSKANRGVLMPGNRVSALWRARLAEQLGTLKCELLDATAALAMEEAGRLAALSSACALCEAVLPERQPHVPLFEALLALLASLDSPAWPSVYVHWELALLRGLGFGLDLSACAAGGNDQLCFVSPKSGRAVSLSAGEPFRDKLLALPRFVVEGGEGDVGQIAEGLALTGFFIDRHVLGPHGHALPPARARLAERFNTSR